ncbi:MAG: C4-type zinc ribbon domain-containing protein [Kiritimatiellia bacterium]
MASNLDQLIALQEKDRKLLQLRREARNLPEKKKSVEAKLAGAVAAVEAARGESTKATLEIREIEVAVETLKAQVRKYKSQQFEIRSNEAYWALEDEIRDVNRSINQHEERELVLMEKMETLKTTVGEKEAILAREKEVVSSEIAELDKRLARIQQELDEREAERAAQAALVDAESLARYEVILKNKGDTALARVEGSGVCGGCFMKLTPQQVFDIRNTPNMVFCNYCGRMLYYAYGQKSS